MRLETFKVKSSGKIKGHGSDVNGKFQFKGRVNYDHTFALQKKYSSWTIHYFGEANWENTVLKGHWGMAHG